MGTQERRRVVAAQTGLYLVVVLGIGVLVNILSYSGYNQRFDWTASERYTLSQGSAHLVQSLQGEMNADFYVTRGLAQLDVFVDDVTDLLKEYEANSEGKFSFSIVETDSEESRKQAEEAGLQPMAFGQEGTAQESGKIELTQGFMGLVLKYGGEKGVMPQLHPSQLQGLEFWISNKIREVRDKEDDISYRIGVVTGKDELKLSDKNLVPRAGQGQSPSIQDIMKQALPFYTIEEVDLGEGAEAIDKELAGLIITQPRKEYTKKELRRIDEFLMLGNKSLAVYVSAASLKPQDAAMDAELNLWGLEPLLEGYGLKLNKNLVFDFGGRFTIPVPAGMGRMQLIPYPGVAVAQDDPRFSEDEARLDAAFPPFFRMPQVAFPFPSSIELLRDKQPAEVELRAVARTTNAVGVHAEGNKELYPKTDWRIPQTDEQRIIAAVAEGKLKSAMGKGDGVEPNATAPEPSRVLLVGSGLFLTNPFAYTGNGPELGGQFQMFGGVGGDKTLQSIANPYAQAYLTTTILSIKNTLDWMSGDQDLIAVSAKLLGEPNLTFRSLTPPKITAEDDEESLRKKDEEYRKARERIQTSIQWALTLGLPFLFVLIGLGRWQWRTSKRNQKRI
jgi:ABC-type uncharacterized transport system involved in gliding motility auxiliary subunit